MEASILPVYDQLVARCETLNQLTQLYISLELTLTPTEVVELQEQLGSDTYWQLGLPLAKGARASSLAPARDGTFRPQEPLP